MLNEYKESRRQSTWWVQCKWKFDTTLIHDFAENGVYFEAKPRTYNLKIRGIFLQKICHKNHLNADELEILAQSSEFYLAWKPFDPLRILWDSTVFQWRDISKLNSN